MRFLGKLLGLLLVLVGIYFLGQNIIFTSHTAFYWWRNIPAAGSVLALVGGVITLLYGGRGMRELGWILIGLAILLVLVSGGVILRPTSLWILFLSFVSLISGFQLITTGRVNF